MAYMHSTSVVVRRDLNKPGNVLGDTRSGVAKLADFGVAAELAAAEADDGDDDDDDLGGGGGSGGSNGDRDRGC